MPRNGRVSGADLQVGDEAYTDYDGVRRRVRITHRREGVQVSETNVQLKCEPRPRGCAEDTVGGGWLDANWYEPVKQLRLF